MAATGPRRNVDIRSGVAPASAETVASPIKQSKTVQHEYDPSKQSDEQKKAKQELKRRFDQEKAQAAEKKRIEQEEQERKKAVKQQMSSDRTSQQTIDAARERAAERAQQQQQQQHAKRARTEAPEVTASQAFGAGVFVGVAGTLAFNRFLGGVAKAVAVPVAEAALEQ